MVYTEIKNDDLELEVMEKRKKELLVKKKHENKISQTGNQWRTRLKDAPSGRLTAKTYDELINKLYVHYYEPKQIISTVSESFYAWVKMREESSFISSSHADHLRSDYKKYVEKTDFSNRKISEIKRGDVKFFFENMVGDGHNILNSTFRNVRTCLNGAFSYAYTILNIDCIDVRRLDLKDIKNKCKRTDNSDQVYTEHEIETLLAYLLSLSKHTTFSLSAILCCCVDARIGELRALTWEDIDFNNKIIYLRHQIVRKKTDKGRYNHVDVDYMKAHSKKGKRIIEMSNLANWVLYELKKINGSKKYVLNSRGKLPITTNAFNDHLKIFCKDCGIEYRSSHKVRFYIVSKMYEFGIEEDIIMGESGHTDIDMTRHYNRSKRKRLSEEQVECIYGYGNLLHLIKPKITQCL